MKGKILISIGIVLLFVAPIVLAEDQEKEISVNEAMKFYCKTWINPAYNESTGYTAIKKMNKDGTFETYDKETSESPMWEGRFEIEKSWVDKDGNIWLKMIFYDWGTKKYTLAKISEDGNVLEQIWSYKAYPTAVKPDEAHRYFIMKKK